jgi:hypothetical protein
LPEEFHWSFELIDKVSASASRMERSLVNIERAITHTQGTARAGSGSWAMFGIKMGAVAGIASEVTRSLINLGGQVLRMGVTGAKWALEAGSFNENTQLSLEAILGSASAAQKAVSTWRGLAEGTPFEARNVIEWGKQLTIAGESLDNTVTIMKAAADVGTKLGATAGEQKEFADQFVKLLGGIRQLGSEASIRNLRQFKEFGVSPEKIEQELAGRLAGGNIGQLRKMMEMARTTGQDLSWEIVRAALQVTQNTTGTLGNVGKKGAGTLTGEMERFGSRVKFDLFAGIEKTAGYKAIVSVLHNLNETLNPKSATGAAIMGMLRDLGTTIGDVLKPLTGTEGRENMKLFFGSMIDLARTLVPLMADIAKYTAHFVEALAGKRIIGGPEPGTLGLWDSDQLADQTREMINAQEPSRGVPPMLARPSLTVQTTVHVHGNADTDNLVEKIDTQVNESMESWLDRMGLHAGAQ